MKLDIIWVWIMISVEIRTVKLQMKEYISGKVSFMLNQCYLVLSYRHIGIAKLLVSLMLWLKISLRVKTSNVDKSSQFAAKFEHK